MPAEDKSQRKLKAFISYSRDDLDFADQLDAVLDGSGFEATIDRHGISAADDWRQRLGELIRDADSIVFVLSPSSAASDICRWEVEEATRLAKRIVPVVNRPLSGVAPPRQLTDLNYIHFYSEPKVPGSGFGTGLLKLIAALNEDPVWIREHTRLLALAHQWNEAGRPDGRLLSGDDIAAAKAWMNAPRRSSTAPTALHEAFIRASEDAAQARVSETRRQLEERESLVRQAEEAVRREAVAQRFRARMRNALLGVTSLAAIVAGVLGYMAKQQRDRSDQFRKDAQLTQSKFLADVASVDFDKDDALTPTVAALYALEALPDANAKEPERRDRPAWPKADRALSKALAALREEIVVDLGAPVRGNPVELPDGRLAVRSDDNDVRLVDLSGQNGVRKAEGHTGVVSAMALLKDGRLATASDDKTIRLWPPSFQGEAKVLSGHDGAILSLAVLADGSLASGAADGTIRIWDVTSGQAVSVLTGYRSDSLVALSDGRIAGWLPSERVKRPAKVIDGQTVPEWLADKKPEGQESDVKVWAPQMKTEPDVLAGTGKWVTSFCETANHLIAGLEDGSVRLWPKSNAPAADHKFHGNAVRHLLVRNDGQVVSMSLDAALIWTPETPEKQPEKIANDDRTYFAFPMTNNQVVFGNNYNFGVYDAIDWLSGAALYEVSSMRFEEHIAGAMGLTNQRLATWTSGGVLAAAEMSKKESALQSLTGHGDRVSILSHLDNGSLASVGWDQTVRIWDWRGGKQLHKLSGFDSNLTAMTALPQSRIAIGLESGEIAICSPAASACDRRLKGHTGSIAGLTMLDGQTLAASSEDGIVTLWEYNTGKEIRRFDAHAGPALGLATLGHHRLAAGGGDGKIRIWNTENGSISMTLEGHEASVDRLAALPDGRLVSGSSDQTVRLWDINGGSRILATFGNWIAQLFVLEDGRIAASSPMGLKVIDPDNVTMALILGGSSDSYYGLAPLPGRRLAAGYSNGDIKFYKLPLFGQELVDQAKSRMPRCLTAEERERQFLSPTPPAWCLDMNKFPHQRSAAGAASQAAGP